MNSRQAESQIEAAIEQLKTRGEHMYAALLEMQLFNSKGYLPDLRHALEYAKECLTQPMQSNKS